MSELAINDILLLRKSLMRYGNRRALTNYYYYPYGMLIEPLSNNNAFVSPQNTYKYQDKELVSDLNLNMEDFGLRQYDPVIGRWNVPDPMMQEGNPYVAMGSNPVSMSDPSGGWALHTNASGYLNYDAMYLMKMNHGAEMREMTMNEVVAPAGHTIWGDNNNGFFNGRMYIYDENGNTTINDDAISSWMHQITGGASLYGIGANGQSNFSFFEGYDQAMEKVKQLPGATISYNGYTGGFEIGITGSSGQNYSPNNSQPPSNIVASNDPNVGLINPQSNIYSLMGRSIPGVEALNMETGKTQNYGTVEFKNWSESSAPFGFEVNQYDQSEMIFYFNPRIEQNGENMFNHNSGYDPERNYFRYPYTRDGVHTSGYVYGSFPSTKPNLEWHASNWYFFIPR